MDWAFFLIFIHFRFKKGMISIGEKIDLEKFVDFNDIDKFVNTGTFAMLLPEDNKEDYVSVVILK